MSQAERGSLAGNLIPHRGRGIAHLRRNDKFPGLGGIYRIQKEHGYMTKLMSKSELIQKIAEKHPNEFTPDNVKGVLDVLAEIGHAELKDTAAFLVPGFAKFEVVEKPATEAHEGVNPFTKEPMMFQAKPARKTVRARPVKAVKDAV